MMSTINGKIIADNWGNAKSINKYYGIYEDCHETFGSNAWLVGRITMERHFSEDKKIKLKKTKTPILRKPFIGNPHAETFAIVIDAHGKLRWKENEVGGDHIIEVLTEQVSDEFLNHLEENKISYIFAGKKELNFNKALQQLADLFDIDTIMLEGGGHINGSFLNEELINELSILIIPVADSSSDTPTTFELGEYDQKKISSAFKLKEVKKLAQDIVWLKYTAKK